MTLYLGQTAFTSAPRVLLAVVSLAVLLRLPLSAPALVATGLLAGIALGI